LLLFLFLFLLLLLLPQPWAIHHGTGRQLRSQMSEPRDLVSVQKGGELSYLLPMLLRRERSSTGDSPSAAKGLSCRKYADASPSAECLEPLSPTAASRRRRTSSAVFCPSADARDPLAGSWLFDDGEDGQSAPWETFLRTPGAVFTRADTSLVDHTEDYIINLCDCISTCAPRGDSLARRICNKYPCADVFRKRRLGSAPSVPGTAKMAVPVINLFSQCTPGEPLSCPEDLHHSPYAEALGGVLSSGPGGIEGEDWVDSASMRLQWFHQGLEAVAKELRGDSTPKSGRSESKIFIGLPGRMGETDQMGPQYLAAIYTFAKDNDWLKLSIYADSY